MAFGFTPPNYPANGLGMSDEFPYGTTLAGLAQYRGSMYVLAARPRRGSRYAVDTAGFVIGQIVNVYGGQFNWNGHRYVAPVSPFNYEFLGTGKVWSFGDHSLEVFVKGVGYVTYNLRERFAIETIQVVRATGDRTVSVRSRAAVYPTRDDDRE